MRSSTWRGGVPGAGYLADVAAAGSRMYNACREALLGGQPAVRVTPAAGLLHVLIPMYRPGTDLTTCACLLCTSRWHRSSRAVLGSRERVAFPWWSHDFSADAYDSCLLVKLQDARCARGLMRAIRQKEAWSA